ncbi:MAG TPA: hypothetical protein VFI86_02080 [Burkholderiales bacterium]|nr:hypothetical protein [Burkholderiales bacterium]
MVRERVRLGDKLLVIELDGPRAYRLAYGELVEYTPGRRRVRGRALPYALRSVEQMRYDFERDVRSVGGELG